jgi:hypothetical protein
VRPKRFEQIRHEIETIEKSANRLRMLAEDNPAMRKNAEVILTFAHILKVIIPGKGKEED